MMICEKIKEKTFEGKTTKEAYLDCCKWLSTNVIAVNNSNHITYTIEKVDVDGWSRKVKLTLYVTADEQEIEERHCNICKEFSNNLFMTQNKHMCEVCKMQPYIKRMKDRLNQLKEGMKGKILI